MSDLIDRQAAMDALADYIHNVDKVIGTGHLSEEDCKDVATSVLEELASGKEKPFKLPEIYVADGYDTVMGEDGNVGFGVYVPDEKQIYIAGDVDNEVRLKALFHELCHWAQDMCGRSFDEDEANEFSDIVYDALPSAQPEQRWIPCSERLPEDEQPILFSTTTGRVHQGRFHMDNSINQWYSSLDKMRAYNNIVNAWMPLPEPYKAESEGDE